MAPVALQLYSVRESSAQDFPAALARVAKIGYTGVELAGLQGLTPAAVRKLTDDLSLRICSAHMSIPTAETVGQLVDDCNALGVTRLVSGPGGPIDTMENVMASVAKMKAGAEALEGTGISLGLHNHWAEFELVDGKYPEDVLLDNVPGLFAQLDVYWIAVGGPDPVATVARLKDRAPLLHIKDGPMDPPQPMTAIGKGKLDMPAIIAAADPNLLEWLIVELDSCATDMWEAVEDSYRYLVDNALGS